MQTNIEERVKKIIREQMAIYGAVPDVIKNEDRLADEAGFDSLDLVEAIMGIEDEFGIYIDDAEMLGLKTVQKVIDCVTEKVAA